MRRNAKHIVALAALAAGILGGAAVAKADGLIVPIRPDVRVRGSWAVKYHHVNIQVRDQVASVSIEQAFVNTGAGMVEVEYLFPVPPGAAVDSLTLKVNGKEFAAKMLKAEEARKIYEDIVRTKKDPALLEYAGFGMYRTKAFPLEPGKPAEVLVTYKGLCHKDRDLVEVWYPLNTEKYSARPVEDVQVTVDIQGRGDTLAPYSPSHEIKVERKAPDRVIVSYEAKNTLPATDFQVYYSESAEKVGASLTSHQEVPAEDGYFMLLVSPNPRTAGKDIQAKDFVIAFDHSGSMSGKKIAQAKDALAYVIGNLNASDRFNVVSFNDSVEQFFKAPLVEASGENVKRAKDILDRVEASGGTDIDGALTAALKALGGKDGRPKYLLFLTDGIPTVGVTDEKQVLADAAKANGCGARVFAFGVGYDVNVQLLERLINEQSGRSEYVKPAEPIEAKVSSLYNKIKNPVMTELSMDIRGLRTREVYPRTLGDLFDGDQMVVVGRYDAADAGKLPSAGGAYQTSLTIKGKYEGAGKTFEYPVTICGPGRDLRYAFVEKLWAIRRVGFLLDEIHLNGQKQELVDEVVRLGTRYGIMTPYTSFLADERTNLADARQMRLKAGESIAADFGGPREGADAQRSVSNIQGLARAAKSAPPSPVASGDADGFATAGGTGAGHGGGSGGGSGVMAASPMIGQASRATYEEAKTESVGGVRNVGQQAVYCRGKLWVASNASDVDLKKDAAKVQEITRFSDEYFKLIRGNSTEINQVLASQRDGEELLVRMQEKVYLVK